MLDQSGVDIIADKVVLIYHNGDAIEYYCPHGIATVNTLIATDETWAALLLWILDLD